MLAVTTEVAVEAERVMRVVIRPTIAPRLARLSGSRAHAPAR